MKTLLKKYVMNFNRIAIISDHVSHIASDIVYESIIETMKGMINHKNKFNITGPPYKVTCFDEFESPKSNKKELTRADVFGNIFSKFNSELCFRKDSNILILRCETFNNMSGNRMDTIPRQVLYESDLIIEITNNKLSVVKDRYGDLNYFELDTRNLGKSYKLSKILHRINS